MMLLQAGQLGLYRRDSIWTNDIPPDMVAGATLWLDFTDSSTLFADDDLTGGNVTDDGAVIGSVQSKVHLAHYFYGAGGMTPTLKVSATGTRNAGLFASAPYGMYGYDDSTNTNTPISTFLGANKLIVCGVKITAAGTDTGTAWTNDLILSDVGGYVGLYLSKSGSVVSARAYNYSGGTQEAIQTFNADEWVVITMSHQSGQLRCRVNGGAWASVASGATDALTGNALIASGSAPIIEIAHLATMNTAQTDAAISAVERWIANDLGITPW